MPITSSAVGIWNRALGKVGVNEPLSSEDDVRPEAAACERIYQDMLTEVLEAREWLWALRQQTLTSIATQSTTYAGDDVTTEFAVAFPFLQTSQIKVELDNVEQTATTHYTVTLASGGVPGYITMVTAPATGETLKVTVTTSRVGWEYIYALPADCVTPVALLYNDQRLSLLNHRAKPGWARMINDAGDGFILCTDLVEGDIDGLEYVARIDYVPAMPRHFINCLAWRMAQELALILPKDFKLSTACQQEYYVALNDAEAVDFNSGAHEALDPETPSITARG